MDYEYRAAIYPIIASLETAAQSLLDLRDRTGIHGKDGDALNAAINRVSNGAQDLRDLTDPERPQ